MKKRRKWLLWSIGCLTLISLLIIGTSLCLFNEPFGWVEFFRGPEEYRIDFKEKIGKDDGFTKILAECETLAKSLDETKDCLVHPTNLPPVLESLKPQAIRLHGNQPFMDIQVSGGFYHRGLLVSLNITSTNAPTQRWLRRKLAHGVYEYRE